MNGPGTARLSNSSQVFPEARNIAVNARACVWRQIWCGESKLVMDTVLHREILCLIASELWDDFSVEKEPFENSDMDRRTKGRQMVVLAV